MVDGECSVLPSGSPYVVDASAKWTSPVLVGKLRLFNRGFSTYKVETPIVVNITGT